MEGLIMARHRMMAGTPVNVLDFDAKGDGVTDDADAIQAAIDYAHSNKRNLFLPRLTYAISKTLYLPENLDMQIEGHGSEIVKLGDWTGSWLWINRYENTEVAIVSTDLIKNRRYFTADSDSDAAKFQPGELITITSDKLWYYDDRDSLFKGETHVVDRVSGSTVYLKSALRDTYVAVARPPVDPQDPDDLGVPAETIIIKRHKRNRLVMRDLTFNAAYGVDSTLGLNNLVDSLIENINVLNGKLLGMTLVNCYGTTVRDCRVENMISKTTGYGMQTSQCTHVTFENNQFFGCRRGIDLSGKYPTRGCLVTHNFCDGAGYDEDGNDFFETGNCSGFGSHSPADANVYDGNVCTNVYYGFISRGQQEVFQNNLIYGRCYGYFASVAGGAVTVKDNVYQAGNDNGLDEDSDRMAIFAVIYDRASRGKVIIKGNIIDVAEDGFIIVKDSDSRGFCERYYIQDNTVDLLGTTNGGGNTWVYFLRDNDAVGIEMRNSHITNNRIGAVAAPGGYNRFYKIYPHLFDPAKSCIVDGLQISPVLTVGAGNVSAVKTDIYADVKENRVRIYGQLVATFAGADGQLITLDGIPKQRYGDMVVAATADLETGKVVNFLFNGFSGSQGRFYLSKDTGVASGLTDGTYKLNIDITYLSVVDNPY